MKETRTINLNGKVYHIDNDAYQLLYSYLQDIEHRIPETDRQEVMSDVEARIAELLQKSLFAKNVQVVNVAMIQLMQSQIGEPFELGPNYRPQVKVNKVENAGCGRAMSIALKIIIVLLALPAILLIGIVLFTFVIALFAMNTALGASFATLIGELGMGMMESDMYILPLLVLSAIALVVIPIIMVVYAIVTFMRTKRGPKARFWWVTLMLWLLSVIGMVATSMCLFRAVDNAPLLFHAMTFENMDLDEAGVVTKQLILPAYHSVELHGAAELHICNASEVSTFITTNLLQTILDDEELEVAVRDSVLHIVVPTHLAWDDMMLDFRIASPNLRKLSIYGAGKIEMDGRQVLSQPSLVIDLNGAAQVDLALQVQTLIVNAKGASKLELEGSAEDVHLTIAGAGKVEAEELQAQVMHINCSGASKAEVYVVRELWAQAFGASKIKYNGQAVIKQGLAVGGSVIVKDR